MKLLSDVNWGSTDLLYCSRQKCLGPRGKLAETDRVLGPYHRRGGGVLTNELLTWLNSPMVLYYALLFALPS
jgi:hypothetical protein